MEKFIPAILDESRTEKGNIIGNTAETVFYYGKPVALEGSVTSSGATVLKPPEDRQVYIEGRVVAAEGDLLSDGSILLPLSIKDNQNS